MPCPVCDDKDRPIGWFDSLNQINKKRHIQRCSSSKAKLVVSPSPMFSRYFFKSSDSSSSASSSPSLSLNLSTRSISSPPTPSLHLTPKNLSRSSSSSTPFIQSLSPSPSQCDTYTSSTLKELNRPRKRIKNNLVKRIRWLNNCRRKAVH